MSDTPRTDAFAKIPSEPNTQRQIGRDWADFARGLERELAAADVQIAAIRHARDEAERRLAEASIDNAALRRTLALRGEDVRTSSPALAHAAMADAAKFDAEAQRWNDRYEAMRVYAGQLKSATITADQRMFDALWCLDDGGIDGAKQMIDAARKALRDSWGSGTKPIKIGIEKLTEGALFRIAEKLQKAGASLPAPEVTGTIQGSIISGLCIALALVEEERELLGVGNTEADPNAPWMTEAHLLCSDHGVPHGLLTERIRALRQRLAAPGWKLVPLEPTFDMCRAGGFPWESPPFPQRYRAMLAAAPSLPSQGSQFEFCADCITANACRRLQKCGKGAACAS